MERRDVLKLAGSGLVAAVAARLPDAAAQAETTTSGGMEDGIRWQSTSQQRRWVSLTPPTPGPLAANLFARHVKLELDQPAQAILGFGGAFTERGWDTLRLLPAERLESALQALFGQDGAAFNHCRTPIGANDISRDWYSYDETPGDFALAHFSIERDRGGIIPFIKAAQKLQSDLTLWASPWSPPTWMKKGGHYAQANSWPGTASNGIRPEQLGTEGTDSFILEDRYFEAYARYFGRFVDAYREQGIPISMVMPQNEFNSAQPFPSCVWSPEGLARFIPFLGREMEKRGVETCFGTLERGSARYLEASMRSADASRYIKGVGLQWAGKDALEEIRLRYPDLPIIASEHECGIGTNDWHYTRYGWNMMLRYFRNGARNWNYWNMVFPKGGRTRWGWPQNGLVVVDETRRDFALSNDYWLLRHFSAFVRRGARRIPTSSFLGYDNQLAFRNPDGSVVIVINNQMAEPLPVALTFGEKQITPVLPGDSYNTLHIPARLLG
jgi:glucosylceramidase